jgi:hypothetical protein
MALCKCGWVHGASGDRKRIVSPAASSKECGVGLDLILFYEHFHGDNGAGLGTRHHPAGRGSWARLMYIVATTKAADALAMVKGGRDT